MKKVPILILFCFCLTSLFAGVFFGQENVAFAAENVATTYHLCEASADLKKNSDGSFSIGLLEYVQLYNAGTDGQNHQKDNIILDKDINFKDAISLGGNKKTDLELENTIGSASKPFEGTFKGNGHTISNMKMKLQFQDKTNGMLGLFGYAKGAVFENVQFDGAVCLTASGGSFLEAGVLVGRAENCTFKFLQASCQIDFVGSLKQNTNFGALVGSAENCDFSYIVSKAKLPSFAFEEKASSLHNIGALVGSASNTRIVFAVVQSALSVSTSNVFDGTISLGGVVGSVSEGGSKIINVAFENTYDFQPSVQIFAGQIAGQLCTPLPKAGNISYVHFKEEAGLKLFGNESLIDADLQISPTTNHISASAHALSSLQMEDGKCPYFMDGKNVWHPLLGAWDFEKIWYVIPPQIRLQSFSEKFLIRVASANTDAENAVLLLKNSLNAEGYKYADTVALEFEFKKGMEKFYTPSALFLGGHEVAKILTQVSDGKTTYALSGNENYEIETTQDGNGFNIIIKSVNMATAGNGSYSVGVAAKTFSGKISSVLFNEDGTQDDEVVPGFVYYVRENGDALSGTTEKLTINRISYGQNYRVGTRVKPGLPYAFEGWFILQKDGTTKQLDGHILDINFGNENFNDNFEVFAKYTMNACNITYIMDVGIVKIVVSDTISVENTEQTVPVSKTDQAVKMEIFIEKGYVFDEERFFDEVETYLTSYTPLGVTEKEGLECFSFILDMTSLKDSSFANAFTLTARTSKENNKSNSWLWWVIGGVAGGAFLIGLVVLIIVLAKHRGGGFGGMSGGGRISKKAYKNMYY